jgi:hypothetical protein
MWDRWQKGDPISITPIVYTPCNNNTMDGV